jgi:predicted metal-dependent peptidase
VGEKQIAHGKPHWGVKLEHMNQEQHIERTDGEQPVEQHVVSNAITREEEHGGEQPLHVE